MDVMQATSRDFWWSKRDSMRTVASRASAALSGFGKVGIGCAVLAACTASADDVRPPQDQLFFPSGLAVGAVELRSQVLFVANSNSELRYDSGAITVLDLAIVEEVIGRWVREGATDGCRIDPEHRETLICDAARFVQIGAGVRIGNFATDIALQDFSDASGVKMRVLVPTRGDPSIAWADWDGSKLSCATGSAAFALCDEQHRLSTVRSLSEERPISEEPFGIFADAANGFAMVTHLNDAAVTLVHAPREGGLQITDTIRNVFAADASGFPGATGVAGRTPNGAGNIVYVGSRTENRIQTFTVERPVNDPAPFLLPSSFFVLDGVGSGGGVGSSSDTRGMQFSSDGQRLFVVNRRPPSLQIIDTSLGPSGVPRNVTTGATDLCRQASTVTVLDLDGELGDDERAYVTCFQDGELYVIDPRGQARVEDIITVGRGPYSVAAARDLKKVFVSNFLEDTIAVIDVDPLSANRNRVVLRIGEPRTL
jgi:hypothetical protein